MRKRWLIRELTPAWQAAVLEVVELVRLASERRVKRIATKRWADANRERRREIAREHYRRNSAAHLEKQRRYRAAHPGRRMEIQRRYRANLPPERHAELLERRRQQRREKNTTAASRGGRAE